MTQTGGFRLRPLAQALLNRKIRGGYTGPDPLEIPPDNHPKWLLPQPR